MYLRAYIYAYMYIFIYASPADRRQMVVTNKNDSIPVIYTHKICYAYLLCIYVLCIYAYMNICVYPLLCVCNALS